MFISSREKQDIAVGNRLKLTADCEVIKGTFKAGSILRVIGDPDERGEFECVDEDSGERVFLHPALTFYVKVS